MKKVIQSKVTCCDLCGSDQFCYDKCLGCGKDVCSNCKTIGKAVEYAHGVHFSGSYDGTYCCDCDKRLVESGDPLHAAYRAIKALRVEARAWNDDFGKRADTAEKRVKDLHPE